MKVARHSLCISSFPANSFNHVFLFCFLGKHFSCTGCPFVQLVTCEHVNCFSVPVVRLCFRHPLSMTMTLPVDSAMYHWRWPKEESSPLESTPLLSSDNPRQNQKHNWDRCRVVFPSNARFQKELEKVLKTYCKNGIRTTKYTLLTFLPQNLFEQFHRYENAPLLPKENHKDGYVYICFQ